MLLNESFSSVLRRYNVELCFIAITILLTTFLKSVKIHILAFQQQNSDKSSCSSEWRRNYLFISKVLSTSEFTEIKSIINVHKLNKKLLLRIAIISPVSLIGKKIQLLSKIFLTHIRHHEYDRAGDLSQFIVS